MTFCRKCAIPENYPGMSMDETGLCNLCKTFTPPSPEATSKIRESLEEELSQVASKLRKRKYKYHCVVALSGGKDSSYITWLLSKKYKLNVLAVTVDIGFLREQAYKNIPYLTKKLGVDHVFIKEQDLFRTTYKYAFTHNFFSRHEGLACFLCSKLIPNMIIAYAQEQGIPWVARGNFDINAPQLFLDTKKFILTEETFDKFLLDLFSDNKCICTQTNGAQNKKELPLFLHPMNTISDYNAKKVIDELVANANIEEDRFFSEKTTCVISMITMYVYQKIRGYNPYCMDVCNQIRNGIIDKNNVGIQDALMNIANQPETKKLVAQALRDIKEDKMDRIHLKKDLYMPLLDDNKELTPSEYLLQNVIDLESILRQPLLYYPGAGSDFDPFKLFTKNSVVSTVIYCDYVYENVRQAIKKHIYSDLKDYDFLNFRRIEPISLGCRSWRDFWPSEPEAYKSGIPSDAFGLFVEMRLKSDSKVINFIYLCTEAIQTYKILFSNRKIIPTVVVLQDHIGPRNWANFGRENSKLHEVAKSVLPRFLYAADQPRWPGYERVSDKGDAEGGAGNRRALYMYKNKIIVC